MENDFKNVWEFWVKCTLLRANERLPIVEQKHTDYYEALMICL